MPNRSKPPFVVIDPGTTIGVAWVLEPYRCGDGSIPVITTSRISHKNNPLDRAVDHVKWLRVLMIRYPSSKLYVMDSLMAAPGRRSVAAQAMLAGGLAAMEPWELVSMIPEQSARQHIVGGRKKVDVKAWAVDQGYVRPDMLDHEIECLVGVKWLLEDEVLSVARYSGTEF